MAYTNAPTGDSHNVERIRVGGENFLTSDASTAQNFLSGPPVTLNFIDCFPLKENQSNNEPKYRLSKRNSWISSSVSNATAVTAGGAGCIMLPNPISGNSNYYFAVGGNYYTVDVSTAPPCTVTLINAGTAAYLMGITAAVDNSSNYKFASIDNSSTLVVWNTAGGGVTTTNLAGIGVTAYRNIVFLNGYLFAAKGGAGTSYIYNSSAGGVLTTWNSTDFISAELFVDEIVWLEKHHNYLVCFGTEATEFFYDAAIEIGSPLQRQETYASKVGMVRTTRNKNTAIIGDDIYFIGRTSTDSMSLYVVKDFKVQEVNNQYMQGILNMFSQSTTTPDVYSVDAININNNPMVAITMSSVDSSSGATVTYYFTFVYDPALNLFWQLTTAGSKNTANTDIPTPADWIGTMVYASFSANWKTPFLFTIPNSGIGRQIYQSIPEGITTKVNTVTSVWYSDLWDHGTNRWKSISRVDAIGDFDSETLTLAFNQTPNYSQTYTSCTPTYNASTIGYGNNISWYNLGAARRWLFKLTMAGLGTSFIEGLEVEYNIGVS